MREWYIFHVGNKMSCHYLFFKHKGWEASYKDNKTLLKNRMRVRDGTVLFKISFSNLHSVDDGPPLNRLQHLKSLSSFSRCFLLRPECYLAVKTQSGDYKQVINSISSLRAWFKPGFLSGRLGSTSLGESIFCLVGHKTQLESARKDKIGLDYIHPCLYEFFTT